MNKELQKKVLKDVIISYCANKSNTITQQKMFDVLWEIKTLPMFYLLKFDDHCNLYDTIVKELQIKE